MKSSAIVIFFFLANFLSNEAFSGDIEPELFYENTPCSRDKNCLKYYHLRTQENLARRARIIEPIETLSCKEVELPVDIVSIDASKEDSSTLTYEIEIPSKYQGFVFIQADVVYGDPSEPLLVVNVEPSSHEGLRSFYIENRLKNNALTIQAYYSDSSNDNFYCGLLSVEL